MTSTTGECQGKFEAKCGSDAASVVLSRYEVRWCGGSGVVVVVVVVAVVVVVLEACIGLSVVSLIVYWCCGNRLFSLISHPHPHPPSSTLTLHFHQPLTHPHLSPSLSTLTHTPTHPHPPTGLLLPGRQGGRLPHDVHRHLRLRQQRRVLQVRHGHLRRRGRHGRG